MLEGAHRLRDGQRQICFCSFALISNSSPYINHMTNITFMKFKTPYVEFPLWLSGLGAQHSVSEDAGSIPGLSPWVKNPAWPQAEVSVTSEVQISSCCVAVAVV